MGVDEYRFHEFLLTGIERAGYLLHQYVLSRLHDGQRSTYLMSKGCQHLLMGFFGDEVLRILCKTLSIFNHQPCKRTCKKDQSCSHPGKGVIEAEPNNTKDSRDKKGTHYVPHESLLSKSRAQGAIYQEK
ncbi:hypothetical protein SDC9_190142 [bioreactor metagenome]|uniref:Uncharacterized protein n=1 Tax=bioreactor metagenome TaxID=1076179 RepID=A0A645HU55_9ZZZZ